MRSILKKSVYFLSPLLVLFLYGCSTTQKYGLIEGNKKENEVVQKKKISKDDLPIKGDKSETFDYSDHKENTVENLIEKKNILKRIPREFSMKTLRTKRLKISVNRLAKDPKYVERVFHRSSPYLHYIVDELSKRKMPMELALLPFVESAYRTSATSRAKAAGLWQFIPATGRRFGLEQNWWVDERRNVMKSTQAALDYLQLLHKMMDGDWFLALAAYNWGEASVRKAIRRNKERRRKTGYLNLKMPRETRYYVPKLLAVKEILLNPKKYNINLPFIPDEPYLEKIYINSSIDINLVSEMSGVNLSTIKEINAGNLRPVVNKKYTDYILLPINETKNFAASLEKYNANKNPLVSWAPYTFKKGDSLKKVSKIHNVSLKELANANGIRSKNKFLKGTKLIVPFDTANINNDFFNKIEDFTRPKLIRPAGFYWSSSHKVRRGESLSIIAKKYRTSVKKIKKLNNLSSTVIYIGQKLKIFSRTENNGIHNVRKGDSLYSIALRYQTSVSELKRINRLASDIIRIGSKLVVE